MPPPTLSTHRQKHTQLNPKRLEVKHDWPVNNCLLGCTTYFLTHACHHANPTLGNVSTHKKILPLTRTKKKKRKISINSEKKSSTFQPPFLSCFVTTSRKHSSTTWLTSSHFLSVKIVVGKERRPKIAQRPFPAAPPHTLERLPR